MKMTCPKCGALAGCECGVAYVTKVEYAAMKMDPSKSDRLNAKEINVGYTVVAEARKQLPEKRAVAVQQRLGADGKTRNLPRESEVVVLCDKACEPVYSKDKSVNSALLKVYPFLVREGWTDYQLSLFIEAVKRLHKVAKGSVEWYEATEKRKQEKRRRSQGRASQEISP